MMGVSDRIPDRIVGGPEMGEGMKITRRELECFAQQIARPDFEIRVDDGIKELIGHLERDDYEAVLARAAEIVRERAASSSPIHPKAIRRS